MCLHWETPAVDYMLAGSVEMELQKLQPPTINVCNVAGWEADLRGHHLVVKT